MPVVQGTAEPFRYLSKCDAVLRGVWILFLDYRHARLIASLASGQSRVLVDLPSCVWPSDQLSFPVSEDFYPALPTTIATRNPVLYYLESRRGPRIEEEQRRGT